MTDTLTPEQRSERMGRIRGKDSKAEILVRRLVHGMGFRFRLHDPKLPGKPDIVFPRLRKIIFVHGCFWHRHDCNLGRIPKSRLDFWLPKLDKNRERDIANRAALTALGWAQLTVWECQLRDTTSLRRRLAWFLGDEDAVH
jgi:DNA mismatch endonuclease (patch repair protein)